MKKSSLFALSALSLVLAAQAHAYTAPQTTVASNEPAAPAAHEEVKAADGSTEKKEEKKS